MRLALVPAVLALVAGAACGTGSGATDSLSPVDAVRAAAAGVSNGSSKIDLSIESKAGGQDVTFAGTGAFAYVDGVTTGKMSLTIQGQQIEERIVDGVLYMKVPGKAGFYKLSLKDLIGTQLSDSANPGSSAQILKGVDDVTKIGTATVRGEKTTRYSGTIDLAKVLAKFKGTALEPTMKKLSSSGVKVIPIEAYLDAKNRLRRMTEHVTLTVQGIQDEVTTQIDLYDFGTKVEVSAPPASEVHDGSELLKALKGQAG